MSSNEQKLFKAVMNSPEIKAGIAGAATPEERVDFIVRLGDELGLPVTREDVERFIQPPPDGELSDLELETVVGGKGDNGQGKHIVGHDEGIWNSTWGLDDDNLEGGSGDDTMEGLGGDDGMTGGGGDDSMDGEEAMTPCTVTRATTRLMEGQATTLCLAVTMMIPWTAGVATTP